MKIFSVQFVCLGNICRSPLAHGLFEKAVREAGLEKSILIESSGTGAWHVGHLPDARMRQVAAEKGCKLSHRARKFSREDLIKYDLVLAMDKQNRQDILEYAQTDEEVQKVKLFRDFDPEPGDGEVPDPYYGGNEGFYWVYEMVLRTSNALLEEIRHNLLT